MEEKRKITSSNKIPGCERLTRPEEIKALSKYLGAIRETQENWIDENVPDKALPGIRNQAKFKQINELPEKKLGLDTSGSNERVQRAIEEKYRESLDPKKINHLPEEVVAPKERVKDITKLPQSRENLEVPDLKKGLPSDAVILGDVKDPELKPGLVGLENTKDPELKPGIERLENIRDLKKLPNSVVALNTKGNPELSKTRVRLNLSEEIEDLPDSIVGLHTTGPDELPDSRIDISPDDPSLDNTKLGLYVPDDVELPDTRIDLRNIGDPDTLPNDRIDISPSEPVELPDSSVRLSATEPDDLRDTRIGIIGDTSGPQRLSDFLLDLHADGPKDLPNSSIGLEITEPTELPNSSLRINPEGPEELYDSSQRMPNEIPELDLEDTKVSLKSTKTQVSRSHGFSVSKDPTEVNRNILNLRTAGDASTPGLDIERIENVIRKFSENELYEAVMALLLAGNSGAEKGTREYLGTGDVELAGIISTYLGSDKYTGREALAAQKILEILEKQKALRALRPKGDTKSVDDVIDQRNGDRYNVLSRAPQGPKSVEVSPSDGAYRMSSVVQRVPYKLPESNNDLMDISTSPGALFDQDRYIRSLAEIAADAGEEGMSANGIAKRGSGVSSFARRAILELTLKALVMARDAAERLAKVSRGTLPGGNTWLSTLVRSSGQEIFGKSIEDLLRKLGNIVMSGFDNNYTQPNPGGPLPRRKPSKDTETGEVIMADSDKVLSNTYLDNKALTKSIIDETKVNLESLARGTKIGSAFLNLYETLRNKIEQIKGLKEAVGLTIGDDPLGIGLTLHDLCGKDISDIGSMEELHKALKDSPYITTAKKFRSTMAGGERRYGNLTLDSNAYWEVVIEPLCDPYLNGGYSYLPSIGEINRENRIEHGARTGYSKWIPINNFELQKSKITSKSLGLFDGEINYPISIEYTNELRVSVVDDQFKSWRRYFQRCADVSVYFSEAHTSDFYFMDDSLEALPTAIDKTSFCTAFYQNITFNIRIYVMTPQYSTIKKFDLLCVLKDFGEEYFGEIDSGSTDLNLSFSIVGDLEGINLDRLIALQKRAEALKQTTQRGAIKSDKAEIDVSQTLKNFGPQKYKEGIITVGNLTEVL